MGKILLCGDVRGQWSALAARLATVQGSAAGPFDACFCVGPAFDNTIEDGENSKNNEAAGAGSMPNFPLPVYCIGDYGHAVPITPEIADAKTGKVPNLHFLIGGGVKEIAGIRVGYLSGRYDSLGYNDDTPMAVAAWQVEGGTFLERHTRELERQAAEASPALDVLLTNEWPQGVLAGASPQYAPLITLGNSVVAKMARKIAPRYHVVGSEGHFVARSPYKNEEKRHVTRFLALGSVGNNLKQKWLHALGLSPAAEMAESDLNSVPQDCTQCPFLISAPSEANGDRAERTDPDVESSGQSWRWSMPGKRSTSAAGVVAPNDPLLSTSRTVFVKNLPFSATEGQIADFFGSCGQVESVRLGVNMETGRSKGTALVDFSIAEEAQRANKDMRNADFMGRSLFVQLSKDTPDRKREDGRIKRQKRDQLNAQTKPPAACWFCLSNPQADLNLVISVASNVYITMDKGPLVPEHVLLIPIEHIPNIVAADENLLQEISSYLGALRKFFSSKGKALVMFERHMSLRSKGGNHCHINVLSIPSQRITDLESFIIQFGRQENIIFDKLMQDNLNVTNEYLTFVLPDNSVLTHVIQRGGKFKMDFPRVALANYLEIMERADWKNCKLEEAEEIAAVEVLKTGFEPFDPSKD